MDWNIGVRKFLILFRTMMNVNVVVEVGYGDCVEGFGFGIGNIVVGSVFLFQFIHIDNTFI